MKLKKPLFWSKNNNLFSFILFPFSLLIQLLFFFKNIFLKTKKISIPVICVGNIYLGGTGKTPLSIEIVRILKKFNMAPVLIKKFYKDQFDEIDLINSKNIEIIKNSSRYIALKEAEERGFKSIVLDDGFQDHSIYKDLSILCFNEKQLIGNGFTIPAGPLREPLSALRRSKIILINGKKNEDFENKIKSINNEINIFYSKYIAQNSNKFLNENILAFAGIGNPENFFDLLKENNINVEKKISFPDHYNYSKKELDKLLKISKENNLKLLTTEKDFFRIKHFNTTDIDYLTIKLEIINEELFEKELKKHLI
ncbi:MAG: tetraacyldisaccharide 4'-kinase [Pelagibacteraceae bacterium]